MCQNTEVISKLTETVFKEISGDIWRKVAKIDKNTEGVIKLTETDFKEISGDNWQNTEEITGNHFDMYY